MASTALARPPFAVDDQDTQYLDHSRQPRRPREERNKISESTYNAYDNYLDPADHQKDSGRLAPGNSTMHRPSPSTASDAHGAIGGSLFAALAADDSDDSDSEYQPTPSPIRSNNNAPSPVVKSKNQALFEAAVGSSSDSSRGPPPPAYEASDDRKRYPVEKGGPAPPHMIPPRDLHPSLHPQHQKIPDRPGPSPTPSITPPPAAPVQVQIQPNAPQPTRPIPAAAGTRAGPPGGLTIQPPHPGAFQQGPPMFLGSPMPGSASPFGSPAFPTTPTPIPTSAATPIQPVFIQPIKAAFIKPDGENEKSSVMSHESTMPILRGDKEDSLPLRTGRRIPRVGEKMAKEGDDFWRRFSMVVKAEKTKPVTEKKSEWLAKTQRGGRTHRRCALCVGIFLLIIIVGAAVTAWWFTRNSPSHQVPETLGDDTGDGHHTMGDTSTIVPTPVSGKKTTSAASATATGKTTDANAAKRIKRMVELAHEQSVHGSPSSTSDDVGSVSRRRRAHAKRSHRISGNMEQVE